MSISYATVEDVRVLSRKTVDDDDVALQLCLDAASRAIDRFCGRDEGAFIAHPVETAREFVGSGRAYQWIDECISVSKVETRDSADDDWKAWKKEEYVLASGDPRHPRFGAAPYTLLLALPSGEHSFFPPGGGGGRWWGDSQEDEESSGGIALSTVRVTARWGYAEEVPADIRMAAAQQALRWHSRLLSGMSDAIGAEEIGQAVYAQTLDASIRAILIQGRYVRKAVG